MHGAAISSRHGRAVHYLDRRWTFSVSAIICVSSSREGLRGVSISGRCRRWHVGSCSWT